MKIGIIGAGQIGGTLTRRLTAIGHQVSVANSRGPATLSELVAETGAKAVSVKEAARSGDVVIVTIPTASIRNLPKDLFTGVPDNVIVVDTGNYYPRQRDGRVSESVVRNGELVTAVRVVLPNRHNRFSNRVDRTAATTTHGTLDELRNYREE